jgi:hypothetical protein
VVDPIVWPGDVLRPSQIMANPVPFTRSGGRSLGGIERSTRTDRGYWSIAYKGVPLGTPARRRMWNAIRISLDGCSGIAAVPAWSYDSAPWLAGTTLGRRLVPHSDGSIFSDGSEYTQPAIVVEMAVAAAIGDTSVTLRVVANITELSGVRFSYNHALYETGVPTAVVGALWTVPIVPAIRAAIPISAALEFDRPTCLVHLATDRAMDVSLSGGNNDKPDVAFIEAVDFWADVALP